MPGGPHFLSKKSFKRPGNFRVIAASFPKDEAAFLRAYAFRQDQPLQTIIRELVGDWIAKQRLNESLNNPTARDKPTSGPTSPFPFPATNQAPSPESPRTSHAAPVIQNGKPEQPGTRTRD